MLSPYRCSSSTSYSSCKLSHKRRLNKTCSLSRCRWRSTRIWWMQLKPSIPWTISSPCPSSSPSYLYNNRINRWIISRWGASKTRLKRKIKALVKVRMTPLTSVLFIPGASTDCSESELSWGRTFHRSMPRPAFSRYGRFGLVLLARKLNETSPISPQNSSHPNSHYQNLIYASKLQPVGLRVPSLNSLLENNEVCLSHVGSWGRHDGSLIKIENVV